MQVCAPAGVDKAKETNMSGSQKRPLYTARMTSSENPELEQVATK
jgi:hypothetical protein